MGQGLGHCTWSQGVVGQDKWWGEDRGLGIVQGVKVWWGMINGGLRVGVGAFLGTHFLKIT